MIRLVSVWAAVCLAVAAVDQPDRLRLVKSWNSIDFDFPSQEERQAAIDSGGFKPENNLPLGLEVWHNKLFVTVPRWKSGVPSTLNYVPLNGSTTPKLMPYPNWEMNNVSSLMEGRNETRVVNTFRIRVDKCDRLWVVDCGLDDIVGNTKVLADTKLLIFDLKTDQLLREHKLPKEHLKENSFFANLVVDSDQCDKSFAYMPDLGAYGLVVYDLENNDSWRVEHHFFHFNPLWGDYHIGGVRFQWTDGIFGVSLKKTDENKKILLFHPLSSLDEFSVSTEILNNKKEATSTENYEMFKRIGSRSPSWQSTSSAIDPDTGVMFYTLINKNAVGCWNSKKYSDYTPENNDIVQSNNVTMIFPNDLILDKSQNVWVLTDKLPIFLYRKIDLNEVNFRIFMAPIAEAIKGTKCEP